MVSDKRFDRIKHRQGAGARDDANLCSDDLLFVVTARDSCAVLGDLSDTFVSRDDDLIT